MSDETGRRRPSEDDNGHVLFLERLYTFSHREKPYQRILIVLMTLFLLSGFAGLFGGGILSNKIATGSEFDVEYQRFMRVEFPSEIVLTLKQVDEEANIYLNSDYLSKVEIVHVTPYPKEVRITDNHIIYTVLTRGSGTVVFYLSPRRAGYQPLEIGVNGSLSTSTLNQYIYF